MQPRFSKIAHSYSSTSLTSIPHLFAQNATTTTRIPGVIIFDQIVRKRCQTATASLANRSPTPEVYAYRLY